MEDLETHIEPAQIRVAVAVAALEAIQERIDALRAKWGGQYSPTSADQEAEMAASDELRAAEAQLAALQDAR